MFRISNLFKKKKLKDFEKKFPNILVVGMPQSGSSALFNIIIKTLELNNLKYESYLYGPKKKDRVANKKFLLNYYSENTIIVKEHHYSEFLEQWADIIFLTKRDIRDSIASRRRRGKGLFSKGKRLVKEHQYDENTFFGFKQWCNYLTFDCFQCWTNADFIFDYEHYVNNKTEVVKDLISILKLSKTKSSDILTYIDTGMVNDYNFNQGDKITKDGGLGKYSKYLSEEEMQYIDKYYAQWIK